jgi:hypothetical protein
MIIDVDNLNVNKRGYFIMVEVDIFKANFSITLS